MALISLVRASFARQKSLYTLWLVSLCAAVSGLVMVDVYRHSLGETLRAQGRKILTADVSVSTRRALTADDRASVRAELPPDARYAELTEMFAMVTADAESRLAMLRFISDDYPLVGELEIDARVAQGRELRSEPSAWVAPDLLALMSTEVGKTLKIGEAEFKIVGLIKKDSSQTFRMGNMAPRVYVHRDYLPSTKLVQFGSTFSETLLAALPLPVTGLKAKLEKRFTDPGMRITVPADLEQGSLRVLSRLLDFLGLTGLITLSLGWIGVYYLGRRWLSLEAMSSAILKAMGVSSRELRTLLLLKLLLVLTAGVLLGGAIAWMGAQALAPLVKESMPAEFELVWSWQNTLLLLIIGPMAGLLLLYRPVAQLAAEKPLALIQERSEARTSIPGVISLIVCASGLFAVLTVVQARSWLVTGTFLGALSVSIVVIAALGFGALKLVGRARTSRWGAVLHLSSALWLRRLGTSLLLIMVSALAGLLSQLLPHLEKTLVGELREQNTGPRPALFMVDIQDEQLLPVQEFLKENGVEVSRYSPFIRARILAVNGQSFERAEVTSWSTREEETEARFRNRGVNLSYREKLSPSESILEGKAWEDHSKEPPEISVEEAYAGRLGIELGDRVKFDVQGIELDASVGSIRKINWDTFEPNFFVQFPEGVLNLAPKTWVMTVKRTAEKTPVEIQTLVTKKFPNVTSINVQETLDNVAELLGKLSSGLKMSSRLALGLGVFVFLLILMFQLLSARRDWQQLLVLGMTAREVWWVQVLTYGGLCLIGTLIGSLLSIGVAWGLFHFAFDSRVQVDLFGMMEIWLITWGSAILGLSWLGSRELRRARGLHGA